MLLQSYVLICVFLTAANLDRPLNGSSTSATRDYDNNEFFEGFYESSVLVNTSNVSILDCVSLLYMETYCNVLYRLK